MSPNPIFASGLSTQLVTADAVEEAVAALKRGLDGRTPDLLCFFVTLHHGPELEGLSRRIRQATGAAHAVGCTGETVVGGRREIEEGPALSLWAAACEEMTLRPFRARARADGDGAIEFDALPPVEAPERALLLLLGEPFTFPMADYLAILNERLPGVPAVGGMASGGQGPGQSFLFLDEQLVEDGALGVVIEGGIELFPVVSQGCRPIGAPLVITSVKDHLVRRLGGREASRALVDILRAAPAEERELFQRGPFLGVAVDARKSRFERGDFLVRAILGVQSSDGAVAVSDTSLRAGQTVQFMVRDAASAGEDLAQLVRAGVGGPTAAPGSVGALLFSCNGRGSRMFPDEPDHDIRRVQAGFEREIPAAGFFAMGEIGPVGGRNFLHGFTASVAVFRGR